MVVAKNQQYNVKYANIKDYTVTITTDKTTLIILLKETISKTKQKLLLDKLTTNITTNTSICIENILKETNIDYYTIVDLTSIKLNNLNAEYNIILNEDDTLLGRYVNKVMQLKSIHLKSNFMVIEYIGGVLIYYVGVKADDSMYADIYKNGLMNTIFGVLQKLVSDKLEQKHTILFSKLIEELTSILPITVIEVIDLT